MKEGRAASSWGLPTVSGPKLCFRDNWQRALRIWLQKTHAQLFPGEKLFLSNPGRSCWTLVSCNWKTACLWLFFYLLHPFPDLAPFWSENPFLPSPPVQDAFSPMSIVFCLYNVEKQKHSTIEQCFINHSSHSLLWWQMCELPSEYVQSLVRSPKQISPSKL